MTTASSSRVVLAILVVIAACIATAGAVEASRRSRNLLWLVCALGCATLVAGIVGQRSVAEPADAAAAQPSSGPWDAAVSLPVLSFKVTPVALGGFLAAVAGLSLVLFFEPATPPAPGPTPSRRLLEDDDSV